VRAPSRGGGRRLTARRYFYIAEALQSYERNGVRIGDAEALNITSIVASKGKDAYHCQVCVCVCCTLRTPADRGLAGAAQSTPSGSNVLSVVFHPTTLRMFAAWESDSGAAWRPAWCAGRRRPAACSDLTRVLVCAAARPTCYST
jgi:hypothetical protein